MATEQRGLLSSSRLTTSSKSSFVPFPDLTGWRTSSKKRGDLPGTVNVSHESKIAIQELKEQCRKLRGWHVEDLVEAAWVIVLIHILSQEGDVEIDYHNRNCQHVKLFIGRDERRQLSLRNLLKRKTEAEAHAIRDFDRRHADNAVRIDFSSMIETSREADQALLFYADINKDGNICLGLSASSSVHNEGSARLHLEQVATCLGYLKRIPANDAVLSLQYFPQDQLAGDNALPEPIHDDIGNAGIQLERFEHQILRVAKRRPDAIALDFRSSLMADEGDEIAGNYLWTYNEIVQKAGIIATEISKHFNTDREDSEEVEIVALCLEKSPYTYVAILAVLMAGAAWCPIDTDWPLARRHALLVKSGARLVLTAGNDVSGALEEAKPSDVTAIRLDMLDHTFKARTPTSSKISSSEALAYLIWTSGTTGLPKAVGIQHKSAVQALRALQRVIPHEQDHIRYLQFSAYNFDLMILDMFYTWGLGGVLCSSTRSTLLTNLVPLSNKLQITHTLLTPAVLAMTPRESIPTLQVVINGGEKLSQVVADIWSVDCCLLNLYGPAEATLIAMHRRVPQDDHVKAPNIGRALATTSCHALDADENMILKGAIGELVLGGHQCALGYIGEGGKTKDKFIQHDTLGRVYKTGDLVRQLYNGEFEYLGRSDDQIKVNGIRIELLEINAVIRNASDQVKDSETLVITSKEQDAQIINFSVLPSSQGSSGDPMIRTDEAAIHLARNLIESARAGLPSYMVPSLFLIVNDFPRTSSAKIDREALKGALSRFDHVSWLRSLSLGNKSEDEIQISEKELLIKRHIYQLCNLSDGAFDRHIPFPSLGLNSIKAISFSSRLHREGIDVSVVDIVQHQTLAALVSHLNEESGDNKLDRQRKVRDHLKQYEERYRSSVQDYLNVSGDMIEKIQPVTDMQEALLLESAREESRYWLHREYNLPNDVDTARLTGAIGAVVQKIEVLRTLFLNSLTLSEDCSKGQNGFVSVVLSKSEPQIMCKREADDDCSEEELYNLPKVFNLKAIGFTPPVAFLLLEGEKLNKLIALLHHALYDQSSLNAIERAMSQCYHDQKILSPLPLLPFSTALPLLVDSSKEERQARIEAWQDLLCEYPKGHTVTIPDLSDWKDKEAISPDEMVRSSRKMAISYNKASKAARDMQTSVRPMLQAAWSVILSAHCDTQHILLGDSISSRAAYVDARDVVGPVLDTVPIPVHIYGSYRNMITSIDKYHGRAIANLPVPIRHIRRALELPKDTSVFTLVFLFEAPEEEVSNEEFPNDHVLSVKRDVRLSVEHPIAVEVSVLPDGGLEIALLAKQTDVSRRCADLLLHQWEAALSQVIENPDSDVMAFAVNSGQDDLLAFTKMSIPKSLDIASQNPVFSCLSKWAQEKPNAPAVEFFRSLDLEATSSVLTYKDLNDQSDIVAKELKREYAAGTIAAVSLHRSILTYISMLAVWKAGLVYLPIDPSLPSERKLELLRESNAVSLLWSQESQWNLDDDLKVTAFDVESLMLSSMSSSTLLPDVDMSSSAYILFTSGSTGKPKGCVLTHANLSSTIEAFRLTIDSFSNNSLDESTRFLARSVEAFDVALLEALMPWQAGGTIVTGPREVILRDIGVAMQHMQVTHAAVVPSLFYTSTCKNDERRRRVLPEDVPTLRALIVGGEKMAQDIIDTWGASNIPLLNAYGPTETCIGNSIARLGKSGSTSNIGCPFPGAEYVVMREFNAQMKAVLRGQPGELCIGGLQVGSYLHGNMEAFIEWEGKRLYRTGDEVRLRHDDTTEYLGRISKDGQGGQVKLRGVRIELSEIDSVLLGASQELRYISTRLVGQPPRLVAFASASATSLTLEVDIKMTNDEYLMRESGALLRVAREKLPLSMIPRQIIPIQCMPLASISGKLDTRRLEQWYICNQSSLNSTLSDLRPHRDLTEAEVIVKEEIEKMLEAEAEMGPETDLFSLGLDSLNIMSLAHSLSKRGIDVEMAYIMMHSTLQEVANPVAKPITDSAKADKDYTDQAKRISEMGVEVTKVYPLLPLQESMVTQTLADYTAGQAPRYINVVRMLSKVENVHVTKLKQSVESTLQHHEIYSSIFVEVQGQMIQAIRKRRVSLSIDDEVTFEREATQQICASMDSKPPLRYHINQSGLILLAIHHALYDGDSLSFFFDEIGRRYRGEVIPPGLPFSDYVMQNSRVEMDIKIDQWQQLLDQHSVTPFPCLTGKREVTNELEKISTAECVSEISLNELKSRASSGKMTLQLYVLKAFARLYAQYTGEEKGIFGLVLGGREGSSAKTHGPCINTVPFAYDNAQSIQAIFGEVLQNHHVSLNALARRMQVNKGHLFNVLFSYLGANKESDFFQEEASDLSTGYPFAFEVMEDSSKDVLRLGLVFNSNLVPQEQASLFLKQLDHLLNARSKRHSCERNLLAIENESPQIPTIASSFLRLFKRQVSEQPEATAFTYTKHLSQPSKDTSYKKVDELSDEMSNYLATIQGEVIGVLMKQCPELYPLVLAVWKAGKAYLPLDPSLPLDRLHYIVSTAKPSIIVSSSENFEMANELGEGIAVDRLLTFSDNVRDASSRSSEASLDRAAYIMFTSGSSGKPKGVQVSHRALAAALLSWKQILPHSKNSRMLQLASPGFDVFLIELCMPLALGFSFASAPKEVLLEDLEGSFDTLGITIADLPAVLASTVQPDGLADSDKMEWLMSGGDQIDDSVIQQWSAKGLVNAWGPTETTIGNTLGYVTPDSSRHWVGKAYPTSSIYILQNDSIDVAFRGCLGEIAIGGPQLADGYLGNAALTEEKFITLQNGVRIYKTGDRGRILYDGSVECLGRMDMGQVKINSQRVELSEIESQLEKAEAILDTCVLYTQHKDIKTKQLVAFFIVKNGDDNEVLSDNSLFKRDNTAKQHIVASLHEAGKHLAPYMIPSICLIMAGKRFPLTPNNKIDTRRLEMAFSSMSMKEIIVLDARVDANDKRKPWSELERKLRMTIAQFCRLDEKEIGQDTSFHRLGIDSISGYRLAKKLTKDGVGNVTLRDLLSNPTIESLALHISTSIKQAEISGNGYHYLSDKHDTAPWQRSKTDRITAVLPCTPLQEGMLLKTLINGLYVHHNLFLLEDKDRLESVITALQSMTNEMDILRTSFHLVEDHFVQAIHADGGMNVIDLGKSFNAEQAKSNFLSSRILRSESDLAKWPIVLQMSHLPDGIIIDLALHHALYDGETLSMLFEEWEQRVCGVQIRARPSFQELLPHLISQEDDERYFVDRLQDASSTLLKRGKESGASLSSGRPCVSSTKVLRMSASDLAKMSAQIDVTVPIIALYAFSKLLSQLSGQRDVIFAQLFGLRDVTQDAETTMGPALNSVISRVSIDAEESQKDTLKRLQRENDEGRYHRRASMANVLRAIRKESGGEALEFDALFDFQKNLRGADEGKVVKEKPILCRIELSDDMATQYGLNVQFQQTNNDLALITVADATIFTKEEVETHIKTLEELIELVVKDASLPSTSMPKGTRDLLSLPSRVLNGASAKGTQKNLNGHMRMSDGVKGNAIQEQILQVIAEVTGIEASSVDVMAPISHLGLDSILAIKVASILRKKGANAGVADIMRGKTIEGISKRINEKSRVSASNSNGEQNEYQISPIESKHLGYSRDDVEAILPLLPGQSFELAEYLSSGGQIGIYSFIFRLGDKYSDDHRLKSAWTRLERRHGLLRTAFIEFQGSPRQIVLRKRQSTSWQSENIAGQLNVLLADAKGADRWLRNVCQIDRTLRQPPVAMCLVKAHDGHFLVLRLHHALYDAGSIDLLMQELLSLYRYEGQMNDTSSSEYADLVRHVQRESENLKIESERYWRKLFRGVLPCFIGKDTASSSSVVTTTLPSALIGQASAIDARLKAKRKGNLAAALVSAWAQCLAFRKKYQNVVSFGLFRRARTTDFSGIETVIGNCMNILPIVVETDKDFGKTLQHVKNQIEEQVIYESTTSIEDILSIIQADSAPWNSYLNLLWDDQPSSLTEAQRDYQHVEISSLLDEGLRNAETEEIISEAWQGISLKKMRADININVHWDREKDCIDIIIRHRQDILTKGEAESYMKDMIKYIQQAY